MRRISLISLACLTGLLVPLLAVATPNPNGAVINTRIFNDCPLTTLNTVNNYPSLISIEDIGLACFGFANLHNWSLSADGGATPAVFDNNSDFRLSANLVISGSGSAEAGLRISPWWSKDVDGRFNVRSTDGEIACFGGRLPFYSFTANHGLHYAKGNPIHLAVTYKAHELSPGNPGTIEYELTYLGNTYKSGVLNFDMANPAEDPPHGLWGILNDARVGGYVQNFMDPGNFNSEAKATFTDIQFVICPVEPDPAHAVVTERVFNDCPLTTLTTVNSYPSLVSFNDAGLACFGFANLHVWTVSDDGVSGKVLNNDHDFRLACDFSLTGKGEGGLRVSPWWSQNADGLFNVRSTDGEIAVFGGRLPFYSFTANNNNLRYTMGDPIHLEVLYRHNGLSGADPATMEYRLTYLGVNYTSGPLAMDMANAGEDPPHGLWGILNDARAGGHMKAFMTPGDFTAATTGVFSNIVFENGPDMELDVTPAAINLGANGQFITAFIEPPAGYAASEIDIASLRLNGMLGPGGDSGIIDHDGDGIADLMVKFPRAAAANAIGASGDVTITGEVGGSCFAATDQVRIVPVHHPANGAALTAGADVVVDWDSPVGMESATAAVYSSVNDGDSWTLEAQGLSNSGRYNWHVPNTTSSKGRVAVVLTAGSDVASGVSGTFTIASPVGVGDPEAVAFALKGVSPNPAKGPFGVSFSLPDAKRATLSLFDVSGRKVASREVGSMGAGRHTVTLGNRLAAGVYMIRLDREGASLTTRAAVVQ